MSSGPLLPGTGSAPVHLFIPASKPQYGSSPPLEGPRPVVSNGSGKAQRGTEHHGTHASPATTDLAPAEGGGKDEERSEESPGIKLNPLAQEFVPSFVGRAVAPIDIPGRRREGLKKAEGAASADNKNNSKRRPRTKKPAASGTWRPKPTAGAEGPPDLSAEPPSGPDGILGAAKGGGGGWRGGTEAGVAPARQAASAAGYRGGPDPNGGRKGGMVSANHLLNFQYESRPGPQAGMRAMPRASRRRNQQPYNKELFLQANFHFLASDLADYTLVARDPDRMLDWEDVAAVDVSASAPVQCPICLDSPPMCPQITSCGHVFCFPCILRYLMMGSQDKRGDHWKKCPLCFSKTCCKDLRMTTITPVTKYAVGDSVRFSLLARSKGSVIPFERAKLGPPGLPINPPVMPPYSAEDALEGDTPPRCSRFAKLTLTSATSALTRTAMLELQEWADAVQEAGPMEDREVLPYVYAAMDQLTARMNAWVEHRETELLSVSPPVRQRLISQMLSSKSATALSVSPTAAPVGPDAAGPVTPGPDSTNGRAAKAREDPQVQERDLQAEVASAMAYLKEKESWVYEDAFSEDEEGTHVSHPPSEGQKPSLVMAETAIPLDDGGLDGDRESASIDTSKSVGEASSVEGSSWEDKGVLSRRLEQERPKKGKGKEGEGKPGGANGKGEEREYYMFYQAEDGQMFILHPLSMKCLLHHYGSYDALPMSLEATLVDVESVTQTDATRKRYRYLSHLPLTATFQFCEVDVAPLLPASALVPFADELRLREQKRSRRQQQEREARAREERQAHEEAAAAAALLPKPPTHDDFQAVLTAIAIAESLTADPAPEQLAVAASPPVHENKLFSRVTKLGYAAGHDSPDLVQRDTNAPPRLSPAMSPISSGPVGSPPPITIGQASPWGRLPGQHSFAAVIASDGPKAAADKEKEEEEVSKIAVGKKGKKGMKMLLSTSSTRRY